MTGLLDQHEPVAQAWTGFRLSHAAATTLRILCSELPEAAPNYLEQLPIRVGDAVSHGHLWSTDGTPDGEPWDGYVPVQGPSQHSVTFIPVEEAEFLETQLASDAAAPQDNLWLIRGLVVIALHSALDRFARTAGVARSQLPEGVETFLSRSDGKYELDVGSFTSLVEFDATRHVFVHCAGVIDEKYQRAVRNSPLLMDERRPVDDALLDAYSRLSWKVAERIRFAAQEEPGAA